LQYLSWPFGGFGGLGWLLHGALNPQYREFRKACAVLTRESDRIVGACRADPNLAARKDLLALFVQAEDQHFTNAYLRDMVLNFVIAGRDTTACALSWMFYVLAMHPDVQDKLIAEIDAKYPAGSGPPTLKSVGPTAMPYLNGVLYEILRLYPPVPGDTKTAHMDDVFPDGTKIPKGTVCMFLPYAMGRDPTVYPDPLIVRPERWIPFVAPVPHEFPVFQAGPRICLGMDMAIFEAKVVAVMLLQKYRFQLLPGEREKIHYSSTITMSLCNSKNQDSHNLWIIPHKRK